MPIRLECLRWKEYQWKKDYGQYYDIINDLTTYHYYISWPGWSGWYGSWDREKKEVARRLSLKLVLQWEAKVTHSATAPNFMFVKAGREFLEVVIYTMLCTGINLILL